jgi:hypothetical protein
MSAVRIPGLSLKQESKPEEELSTESNEGKVFQEAPYQAVPESESTIHDSLRSIITRVEALYKTEERIKALGKLRGALQLLS